MKQNKTFDVIVLPLLDGYDVLARLRKKEVATPVLILTAKDSINDKIKGFQAGADDVIRLSTSFSENTVILRIADTGIGVSDAALQQIFQRFYRKDKARSRQSGGTGLGLSIAEWIVTNHHGSIHAAHNEPCATVFTVRLPKNK